MVYDLHHRMHRASFGVVPAVYQAPNASMNQCARAHGARLNCNKQIAISQTVVTNGGTSLAQCSDLCVGRGVGVADVAIPSAADYAAIAHDNCAHGHFSCEERSLGAAQGFFHPKLIGTRFVRTKLAWNRDRSWVFGLRIGCFL